MATRDQALFLDTLLGLQRALKRKADDSDSDSSIDQSTNRGNKLKRRARLVRAGRLEAADGLSVLAEPVEHAGYRRAIVRRNPPLVDDDGYAVNSDDDDAAVLHEAAAAAAAANPYAAIRLEHLLAPLVAVADLPAHPTLARPFTSKALAELAAQGGRWMHKENAALWAAKPLLAKLCGDHVWVDCRLLVTPDDVDLFDDGFAARLAAAAAAHDATAERRSDAPAAAAADTSADADADAERSDAPADAPDAPDADAPDTAPPDDDASDDTPPFIHPLFLAPRAARADPDLGLPAAEAEDVRRLLQLWVQKQDEVARGARALHEGLLRAERLRKTVLGWSKAEAHTHSGPGGRGGAGALSDGEDWYDPDEWGLTEDLKKGHDEEEEDLQQPKKTRNRK